MTPNEWEKLFRTFRVLLLTERNLAEDVYREAPEVNRPRAYGRLSAFREALDLLDRVWTRGAVKA